MALTSEGIVDIPGLMSRWVKLANGANAHYMTAGDTGPAVILLHGGAAGSSGTAGWRFMAPFLGANGFRVYCPDQPGFGLADTRENYWPKDGILSHVQFIHDFADAQKILNFVEQQNAKRAVVIGAGLTGLECADALARLGLQVSVVERADQVLSKHVDKVGAQKIEGLMRDFGVDFYGDQEVIGIDDNTVQLKSGKILPADMIVVAVGVRPNKIEVKSGEFEGLGGYLKVDECLLTNLPDVWAAGDMIVAPDILTGQLSPSCSWPDAMMQGNIAAQNMVGRERKYPGILSIANSHFFGQDFISCGNLEGENSLQGDFASSYQKCITDGDGLVSGFVLVGDISKYPALRRAILTKQPII